MSQTVTEFEPLNRILAKIRTSAQKEHQLAMKNEGKQISYLYKCQLCKDTGWIVGEDNTCKRCKCYELASVKKLWERSGLKIDMLDKTFKSFEAWNPIAQRMKDTTSNYYLRFKTINKTTRNSIMLCGNPGCGKTHLALALANNFLKKDEIGIVYMQYREVITSLKRNMLDEEYYKKTIGKYKTAEILLIDDLFKGKVNESDINIMFEIVNYRYLNKLPLVISTEFTVERLLEFDEAIGSRIYEMCKDFLMEVQGTENNYRLR